MRRTIICQKKKRMSGCGSLLLLLICLHSSVAQTQTPKTGLKPCRKQPALVGKCFNVRGRLSLYNGAPTIRLWRAGTRRVLGVSASYAQEGYSSIPAAIEQQLNWENELWGDFLVCPFTPPRAKEMQMICVEAGKKIVKRKRR